MTPAQAQRKITKAFTAMEVAYVEIEDVAREYPLPEDLVQDAKDTNVAVHRAYRRLRQWIEQEGEQRPH